MVSPVLAHMDELAVVAVGASNDFISCGKVLEITIHTIPKIDTIQTNPNCILTRFVF